MLKSSKTFVITTEAVNSFGFRVLTAGVDLSQYQKNPILLWMHQRANSPDKNAVLPLGIMTDLKVINNQISGVPNFDEKDDFAMSIYNKVENGIINMASPGLLPIEMSDAPELMKPGQTQPTVTKSVLKEVSLCDIGSNPEALAIALYDVNGSKINLSAQTVKNLNLSTTPTSTTRSTLNAQALTNVTSLIVLALATGKINKEQEAIYNKLAIMQGEHTNVCNIILSLPINPELLDQKKVRYFGRYLNLSFDEIDRNPWRHIYAPQ